MAINTISPPLRDFFTPRHQNAANSTVARRRGPYFSPRMPQAWSNRGEGEKEQGSGTIDDTHSSQEEDIYSSPFFLCRVVEF